MLVSILIGLIPGLMWVYFFYRQDRYEKEPAEVILIAFVAGAFAVIPAAILEAPFRGYLIDSPSIVEIFFASIFVVGLVEEGVKYLAFLFTAGNSGEINEPVDPIIYAVTAGLGFAAAENVLYTLAFGYTVGLTRAFITSLAHGSFSGIVGYYASRTIFTGNRVFVYKGLAIAILLHGMYDFLIIGELITPLYGLAFIFGAYAFLRNRIEHTLAKSPFKTDN